MKEVKRRRVDVRAPRNIGFWKSMCIMWCSKKVKEKETMAK